MVQLKWWKLAKGRLRSQRHLMSLSGQSEAGADITRVAIKKIQRSLRQCNTSGTTAL